MAMEIVEKYQVAWQHSSHVGVVKLSFQGGGGKQIQPLTFEDYSAMVDMLRNEKPVWYDENQALLATFHEPVGEEET